VSSRRFKVLKKGTTVRFTLCTTYYCHFRPMAQAISAPFNDYLTRS